MEYCKRLIEVDLPIKRISAHSRKEKFVRQGHISTIHIWWARRPLAACRAVLCASLWPDPVDLNCPAEFIKEAKKQVKSFANNYIRLLSNESAVRYIKYQKDSKLLDNKIELRTALLDLVADFSDWDNSDRKEFIEASRALTNTAHSSLSGSSSLTTVVFDPFSGGGAFPLESLRLGTDSYGNDYNPLAYLINRVSLEYIPKYGSSLASDVRKWGEVLYKNVKANLGKYYVDESRNEVIGYLWARTIICEGPNCGVEVPIIKNLKISDKKNKNCGIKISYNSKNELITETINGKEANSIRGGTSKRSAVTCPKCGFTTARTNVAIQSQSKGFRFKLLAICSRNNSGERFYTNPTKEDFNRIQKASKELEKIILNKICDLSPIPTEELPYLRSIFNVRVYGIDQWYKLFTDRQLLSAISFVTELRSISVSIKKETSDINFAKAIIECLALIISNSLQYQCNIATYLTEGIKSAFIQGQSLPMKMDFIEANPLMEDLAGGFRYSFNQHLSSLAYLSSFNYKEGYPSLNSALKKFMPDDSVDLLATDPPYYDVVPYADCSDFFYVWLRRMLIDNTDFPTREDLSPKSEEIVQLAERNERYKIRTKNWYETKMREALDLCRQYVKPNGIGIIVFAHKETVAWEALLSAVLNAGWKVTASWPIDTEKGTRLRANDSAVLASSIHLVVRPNEESDGSKTKSKVGDWREVLNQLPKKIKDWMPRLQKEGIVGADAIFACLGPALEIFSQYTKVEKASGEVVTLRDYLEHVWAAVAKEALNMIFEDADATGFEEDSRLTAMWLWTLFADKSTNGTGEVDEDQESENDSEDETSTKKKKITGFVLEYDAARKIALGLGIHLENLKSVVEVKGETATLLSVGERARYLFAKEDITVQTKKSKKKAQESFDFMKEIEKEESDVAIINELARMNTADTTLDKLHQTMLLFAANRSEAMRRLLVEEGIGRDNSFWKLAQALSALYPAGTDEKRWVDGVLARKKGLGF